MARTKSPMRLVAPDEAAPKPAVPKSITEAADAGSTRELLVAMRARIAKTVEDPNCPPRDLAARSRRLQEWVRDIDAIDAREAQEGVDGAGEVSDEEFDASAV